MLAGLETITEGEILIDGRRVNELHPRDRDIAMVFQNYALYPHMTVYQNMALSLKVRKLPQGEITRRVKYAADVLGIQELLASRPSELSGGQKQRVAVGRAIVREPKVFLFDEPLSNLDTQLRVQMRVEIGALHKRLNATMVYVTHDQVEAMTLGSRVVVMRGGFVQQVAPPMELFNRAGEHVRRRLHRQSAHELRDGDFAAPSIAALRQPGWQPGLQCRGYPIRPGRRRRSRDPPGAPALERQRRRQLHGRSESGSSRWAASSFSISMWDRTDSWAACRPTPPLGMGPFA